MLIQKLRLQRGWSQQQLADLSGLSVRTIQRLENGHVASVESLKALAAVFEVDFHLLKEDSTMSFPATASPASVLPPAPGDAPTPAAAASPMGPEQEALRHVRKLKSFYRHLAVYLIVMPLLFWINARSAAQHGWWVQWPALGWGLWLALKGVKLFDWPFTAAWERQQVEKRLGRKL